MNIKGEAEKQIKQNTVVGFFYITQKCLVVSG